MSEIEILVFVLYNLISFAIIIGLLILCKKVIKKEKTKDMVLKSVSLAVVAIHYSCLYVHFFSNQGVAYIEGNMILPIYPCNIVMWLLLIVSFMKNKDSRIYKYLSEFTFIGGTLCGVIGVLFNINYMNNPNILDYEIFKGLISHSVMIFGTVYLGVMNYVKIEVKRTMVSIIVGLLIFSTIGLIINILFYIFNIPGVNAMFMVEPPIKDLPFFNFFTIGILGLLLSFIGLNIYELCAFPKEKRWLTKVINGGKK